MEVTAADKIKDRFSTVQITIVSIFLGLAMEDLFSRFSSIESPSFFAYVILALVSLLVINLWVSYSSMAVCIRLVPKPMDAFMVFGSIMGLYILNFMITRPAYEFFYVHGVFNLGAALATFYNVHRGLSDDTIDYDPALFRPVYALNVAIFILSMAVGLVLNLHLVGQVQEALLASMVLICPPAWLWVFWVNFKQAFPVFAQ